MDCPYQYYKKEEKIYPFLYCRIDDSKCIYSKRCNLVDKYIPLEGELWKECYNYNMEEMKKIPSGANFVQTYRPNKNGKLFLYVVINNKVEKISTELEKIEQNYVYVKESSKGYEISLTPFVEEKKLVEEKKTEYKRPQQKKSKKIEDKND